MKVTTNILGFLTVILLLSGCVAIGPVMKKVETIELSSKENILRSKKYDTHNCIHRQKIGNVSRSCSNERHYSEEQQKQLQQLQSEGKYLNLDAKKISIEDVVKVWGEPKKIKIKDGKFYLSYNRNIAIRGILAVVTIIPIPILLPVGFNETTLIFEKNTLTTIMVEENKQNLFVCGLTSAAGADPFCKTGWEYR